MNTSRFIEVLERGYLKAHGKENNMIEVHFDPDPEDRDGGLSSCLGLLLGEGEHMVTVVAHAIYEIMQDYSFAEGPEREDLLDLDEEVHDFVTLIGTMKVAPYMQWHVAYFEWATPDEDRNATEVLGGDAPPDTERGRMEFDDLAAEFENLGVSVHAEYSGRGMMGRTCLGISGPKTTVAEAWSTVLQAVDDADPVRAKLTAFAEDSLGDDVIMYFPQITKEQ